MPISIKKLHNAVINGLPTKCLLVDFAEYTMVVFADARISAHYKTTGFEVYSEAGKTMFRHLNDKLTEQEAQQIWTSLFADVARGLYSQTFFLDGKANALV